MVGEDDVRAVHQQQVEHNDIETEDKLQSALETDDKTESIEIVILKCFLCEEDTMSDAFYKEHLETLHRVSMENINKILNLTAKKEQPKLLARKDSITDKLRTNAQCTTSQPNNNCHTQAHDDYTSPNDLNNVIATVDKYVANEVIDNGKYRPDCNESVENIEKIAQEVKKITENINKPSQTSQSSKKVTPRKEKSFEPVEIVDLEALKTPKGAVSLIKTESIFTCNICDKNLSLATRGKHIREKHKMKFQDYINDHGHTTRYRFHKCLMCEKKIDWVLGTIIKHLTTQHNTSLPQYELQFKQEIQSQKDSLRTTHSCQKCDKTFCSDLDLQAHQKRVHRLQKSLEVFQGRVAKNSDNKKENYIWQANTQKTKKSVNALKIKHCVNKSLLSGEMKKFKCDKKVVVHMSQMDPVLVIQKMQDYSTSPTETCHLKGNNAIQQESNNISDSNLGTEENDNHQIVRNDSNIDDLLDGSSNFDVESLASSTDTSLELWDYTGLSKQDLGRCINNAITDIFKFSELEGIKSSDKEQEIVYRYPYKCYCCDYRSNDKEILKLHIKEFHAKVPQIFCCDNIFNTKWDEKCHMEAVHPEAIQGNPSEGNPCKDAIESFNLSESQDKKYMPKKKTKSKKIQNKRSSSSDKENDEDEENSQPKMKRKFMLNEIWDISSDKVKCSTPKDNHEKPNFETELFVDDKASVIVVTDEDEDFFGYKSYTKKGGHEDLDIDSTREDDKSNEEESTTRADKSIKEVQITVDEPIADIISSEMETSVDDFDPESEKLDVGDYKTWANQCSISCVHDSCEYITKNLIEFRMHTLIKHDILLEQYLNLHHRNDETEIWSTTVYAKCKLCQQEILNSQEKLDLHMQSSHSMSAFQYFRRYIKLTPARKEEETITYQRPSSSRRTKTPQ